MRARVAVFGTAGVLSTLVAAALAYAPDVVLSVGPVRAAVGWVADVDPGAVLLIASLVVGVYAAVAARSAGGDRHDTGSAAERRYERIVAAPPEAVTADREQLAGADLDTRIRSAVESGGGDLRAVREVLAATAASAVAEREGRTREAAERAVERGEWTDDPRAAAFLADGRPAPPLLARVRLWLAPEAERRRRVRRTVDAIHDLEGSE